MATPPGQQLSGGTKPGAMTMAMQAVAVKPSGPKVLRIALFKGGRGIEERIIRKRETVSDRNVREEPLHRAGVRHVPARFDLFQLVNDEYILNFTDQMAGRVGLPGGVQKLDQLRTSGMARNAGGYWQVKLDPNSKGKIHVGDVMMLFQFVVPPPVTPRPQLPAAARGGFVAGIDWLFTAFVVFSYMTFFGFVIYLENADWEIDQGLGRRSREPSQVDIRVSPMPPPEPVEPTDEPTEDPTEDATEDEPTETSTSNNSNSTSGESSNDATAIPTPTPKRVPASPTRRPQQAEALIARCAR